MIDVGPHASVRCLLLYLESKIESLRFEGSMTVMDAAHNVGLNKAKKLIVEELKFSEVCSMVILSESI